MSLRNDYYYYYYYLYCYSHGDASVVFLRLRCNVWWTAVEVEHELGDGDESLPAEQEPDAGRRVRRTSATDRAWSPHCSRRQARPRRYRRSTVHSDCWLIVRVLIGYITFFSYYVVLHSSYTFLHFVF